MNHFFNKSLSYDHSLPGFIEIRQITGVANGYKIRFGHKVAFQIRCIISVQIILYNFIYLSVDLFRNYPPGFKAKHFSWPALQDLKKVSCYSLIEITRN